jgi:hypothetical protein
MLLQSDESTKLGNVINFTAVSSGKRFPDRSQEFEFEKDFPQDLTQTPRHISHPSLAKASMQTPPAESHPAYSRRKRHELPPRSEMPPPSPVDPHAVPAPKHAVTSWWPAPYGRSTPVRLTEGARPSLLLQALSQPIDPSRTAALPVRSQTSRATSGVRRASAFRPIRLIILWIRSSETRLRKGDCSSAMASPCRSVSSNTPSPVEFAKSASTTVSFSLKTAPDPEL